jgi:hypothetical protein
LSSVEIRWVIVAAGACAGIIGGAYARLHKDKDKEGQHGDAPSSSTPPLIVVRDLHVPKLAGPIALDGETDDRGWQAVARTDSFLTMRGEPARPYSDARFTWGDGKLWVLLYAADEDIRSDTDSFHLEIAGHAFDVNPLGKVSGGAEAAHDLDGTIDDPKDDDEEWVIELGIPYATLGIEGKPGERLAFSAHRCDTPKGSNRTCAQIGEGKPVVLVLEGP